MKSLIGIRREDKSAFERRVPLIPENIRELKGEHSIETILQPSEIRVFPDEEYIRAGASVQKDLSSCQVIFAIKEIPLNFFQLGKTYVFFSHTIKGQHHNIPMLRKILELKCQLIDYEKVVDEKGRRLIFFGEHAGMAGMIDTLWALGQRLNWEGIQTPFCEISQAHRYKNLTEAKAKITEVGEKIREQGLAQSLLPLLCGITGYGNVSRGAQEILDLLPIKEIAPEEITSVVNPVRDNTINGRSAFLPDCVSQAGRHELFGRKRPPTNIIYKIVFKEEHTVEPISPDDKFQLQDYYEHPEKYRSRFYSYLPYLTILVNCIYWEKRYPRLVTKEDLKRLYSDPPADFSPCRAEEAQRRQAGQAKPRPVRKFHQLRLEQYDRLSHSTTGLSNGARLRVIGDISCDIDGSVECTTRCTDSANPIFVYNPFNGRTTDGFTGVGPVVMAVDNLPCELPRESSAYFSRVLKNFIPEIMQADFSGDFAKCNLSPPIKNAVIVYRGKLTPNYLYLNKFI